MTMQKRVNYLELRDRNSRILIDSQSKYIDGLTKIIEGLLLAQGDDERSFSAIHNYSDIEKRIKILEDKLSEVESRHTDEDKESVRAREAMLKAARDGIKDLCSKHA